MNQKWSGVLITEAKDLLFVMELWRLRAREFLSTNDSLADESLAEALSSPNSAPLN